MCSQGVRTDTESFELLIKEQKELFDEAREKLERGQAPAKQGKRDTINPLMKANLDFSSTLQRDLNIRPHLYARLKGKTFICKSY